MQPTMDVVRAELSWVQSTVEYIKMKLTTYKVETVYMAKLKIPHNSFIFLNMVLPKNTGEEKL